MANFAHNRKSEERSHPRYKFPNVPETKPCDERQNKAVGQLLQVTKSPSHILERVSDQKTNETLTLLVLAGDADDILAVDPRGWRLSFGLFAPSSST